MLAAIQESPKPTDRNCQEADLYRVFAYALASPTRERFKTLRSRAFLQSLSELWMELNGGDAMPVQKTFRSFAEYESAYIALFDVGVPEPPVPLNESGHYKSIPAQQIALENVSFYEILGLKVDPSRTVPDHLTTQLEFLSAVRYASENAADEENRLSLQRLEHDFLTRHLLNWIPVAQAKLQKLDPPMFQVLFAMLLKFLRSRSSQA